MCRDGMIIPVWTSSINFGTGDIVIRGVIYSIALVYIFVGMSIISDRLMAAAEVITSKEKKLAIKKPNGMTQMISVRIWNETVSNLTIMALGSSASLILLPLIEVIGHFQVRDFSLGAIVGSAAFNMFITIAICVWIIPMNENRKIRNLRVFIVTMIWSVFAYIWLYFILSWSSPGVIKVWEGIITLLFFPITVLSAYIADQKLFITKFIPKKYCMNKKGFILGDDENGDPPGAVEMGNPNRSSGEDNGTSVNNHKLFEEEKNEYVKEFEQLRQKYIQLLRGLRCKSPKKNMSELELLARKEIFYWGPKSRAFYRLQATKKRTGGKYIIRRDEKPEYLDEVESKKIKGCEEHLPCCSVYFHSDQYTLMKNVQELAVTVVRSGNLSCSIGVDFEIEDGTAKAGSYCKTLVGTIVFCTGESLQQAILTIVDDIFVENKHFYVRLRNPRYLNHVPVTYDCSAAGENNTPNIANPSIATVMILQDDHYGVFGFPSASQDIPESVGEFRLRVQRSTGIRGRVILPFRTVEGSAKLETDYRLVEGMLLFENNENGKDILIQIVDKESYERNSVFYVELGEPRIEEDYLKQSDQPIPESKTDGATDLTDSKNVSQLCKPRLANHFKIELRITENKEFKNAVDNLLEKPNISMTIGTSTWKEQFLDAITVSTGDDENQRACSCSNYVIHFFTIFWKLLFAFVPPTNCLGGWACFITSIIVIGVMTGLLSDLVYHLGCTVGLKGSVTAILLVPIGINAPDIFAIKIAAQNDKYADSSIGNVICSIPVNAFLGIGLSWSILALYHAYFNRTFMIHPGTISFSANLFSVCAFVCSIVLLLRRTSLIGGELGGPMLFKISTVILFVSLWFFFVITSILEAYEFIQGF